MIGVWIGLDESLGWINAGSNWHKNISPYLQWNIFITSYWWFYPCAIECGRYVCYYMCSYVFFICAVCYTVLLYIFIFMGVNLHGFHGHLVICKNNIFVNPRKFLLCESTKISTVQLQPFLQNDPFLLKRCLIAYHVMMALLKYVLYLYLSSLKQQNDWNFSFFST